MDHRGIFQLLERIARHTWFPEDLEAGSRISIAPGRGLNAQFLEFSARQLNIYATFPLTYLESLAD
jgi:hypothetical protein